jgi:predicted nucleic acid-binding protein
LTLGEIDVVLQRDLGADASLSVVEAIVGGAVRLVTPTDPDLSRAVELLRESAEHRPRLADAILVATAERLGIRRVATFDRRPIAIFRPRHVRAFDLEP